MSNQNDVETIRLRGSITGTSNKQSEDFDSDPRKSCYFVLANAEEQKKAEECGLQIYTSKEDGVDFIVAKFSEKIKVYVGNEYQEFPTDAKANNFSVEDCEIALIKGSAKKKTYFRVFAIKLGKKMISIVQQKNPFDGDGEVKENNDINILDLPF